MKNRLILLFTLLALLLSGCQTYKPVTESVTGAPPQPTPPKSATADLSCLDGKKSVQARVVRVIDGDTIDVEINGAAETVRYLAVDTPEMHARNPVPGRNAADYNWALVEGARVELVRDVSDRDEFGRLLRFVKVDGVLINYVLVRGGYATAFIREPDVMCVELFEAAMLAAYRERLGIWQATPDDNGTTSLCPLGCANPPVGCAIKGNVNRLKDKIYHLPDTADYPDVTMDPDKGELWFCTIEEAIANGWRPQRAE